MRWLDGIEMTWWYHGPSGHEFEPTLGDSEGQGSLVCCSLWGHKNSDTTWRLNNNMGISPSLSLAAPHASGPFETMTWKTTVYSHLLTVQ